MSFEKPMGLNIPLEKTAAIVCEKCDNDVFKQEFLIRKASRFVTGTSQDAVLPIPVFICNKCGHINEEFIPPQLKTKETNNEL